MQLESNDPLDPLNPRSMSNVLVTGGAGFIGSNLVEFLLGRDEVAQVRVLDNLSNGYRENVDAFAGHPKYAFVEGDIRDLDTCRAAVDGREGRPLSPYADTKAVNEHYGEVFSRVYG